MFQKLSNAAAMLVGPMLSIVSQSVELAVLKDDLLNTIVNTDQKPVVESCALRLDFRLIGLLSLLGFKVPSTETVLLGGSFYVCAKG
jgi:hypothetical protein